MNFGGETKKNYTEGIRRLAGFRLQNVRIGFKAVVGGVRGNGWDPERSATLFCPSTPNTRTTRARSGEDEPTTLGAD